MILALGPIAYAGEEDHSDMGTLAVSRVQLAVVFFIYLSNVMTLMLRKIFGLRICVDKNEILLLLPEFKIWI